MRGKKTMSYSEIEYAIDIGRPAEILEATAGVLERAGRHTVARDLRTAAETVELQEDQSDFLDNSIGCRDDVENYLASISNAGARDLREMSEIAESVESHGATFEHVQDLLTRCDWHGIKITDLTEALSENAEGKTRLAALRGDLLDRLEYHGITLDALVEALSPDRAGMERVARLTGKVVDL